MTAAQEALLPAAALSGGCESHLYMHDTTSRTFTQPCDLDPFATIAEACVHEHVRSYRACPCCCADMQQLTDWYCTPCDDSAEPHCCPLLITIAWDSGEITTWTTTP